MIHTLVGTEGVGNIAQQVVAEEGVYDTILKHITALSITERRAVDYGPLVCFNMVKEHQVENRWILLNF